MKFRKKEELLILLDSLRELTPNCENVGCDICELALKDEGGFPFCIFKVAENLTDKLKESSNKK